jgi:tetratricopeptide (TPR) repeat protein
MRIYTIFFFIPCFLFFSCGSPESKKVNNKSGFIVEDGAVFQGVSLMGDSLSTTVDSVVQKDQIDKLEMAIAAYSEDPTQENLVWIGRREAYLGRYDLAIRTFTKALNESPIAYEALRHRGHRFISIRKFDQAIADLIRAVNLMEGEPLQIEEDGMPNRLNIPLSNVQFNVWYHLGLAYYLKRDWENAVEAYEKCLAVSDNDDLKVATLDWYYMALMKLGREDQAKALIGKVHEGMEIIENDAYFKRILMYKGKLAPKALLTTEDNDEDQSLQYVTQGYGLGNYFLMQGDTSSAILTFQNVLDTGYWSAFGYIASEMEMSTLYDK